MYANFGPGLEVALSGAISGPEMLYSRDYVASRMLQRNLYAYCDNNPINWADPSGLKTWPDSAPIRTPPPPEPPPGVFGRIGQAASRVRLPNGRVRNGALRAPIAFFGALENTCSTHSEIPRSPKSPRRRRLGCATEYPGYVSCGDYGFPSVGEARRANYWLRGVQCNESPATSCGEGGGTHYNCKRDGEFLGSIYMLQVLFR